MLLIERVFCRPPKKACRLSLSLTCYTVLASHRQHRIDSIMVNETRKRKPAVVVLKHDDDTTTKEKSLKKLKKTTTSIVTPDKKLIDLKPQGRAFPHEPVQCWAHSKTGNRCSKLIQSREGEPIPIPYCDIHLTAGDGALKKVSHPFAGHCLIARHDLPKNYRMVLWGYRGRCNPCDMEDRSVSFYPPNVKTGQNYIPFTQTLKINNYNGVINPHHTGDLLQYASCPGPTERQNMRSTFQYFGLRNGTMGALEYVTLEHIPKNTQVCQWYGSGWWSAREIKRLDVGTIKYPAPKRIDKKEKDLVS